MFTGIIRELGQVSDVDRLTGDRLVTLTRPRSFSTLAVGDSVAVNGVCLTVLTCDATVWQVRLMQETLTKTTLGDLQPGAPINLERAIAAGQRFDGHFVLGHVDGTAEVVDVQAVAGDRLMRFRPPAAVLPYFIAKGSVALDGVSLTIVEVFSDSFTVSLMPYTLEHTTLGSARVGTRVNIEVDMVAKHVAALLKKPLPLL